MMNLLQHMARRDPVLGGYADGYEHRVGPGGFCFNCGGYRGFHYRLVPKDKTIYQQLITKKVYG